MKVKLLLIAGCIALTGAMVPVWKYLDDKEAIAKEKYGIYQQIREAEDKKNMALSREEDTKEQKQQIEEQIKPYEEILADAETVKNLFVPQKQLGVTEDRDIFLKAPYLLDVDGIVKSYKSTKTSVGLNTGVGNFTGFLGKIFFSTVSDVTQENVGNEAILRVQFNKYFYDKIEGLEQQIQKYLIEYSSISDCREELINREDEGELLAGIEFLNHIGELTEREQEDLSESKEKVLNVLVKYDFLLNLYYDLNRDLMVSSSQNTQLLNQVVQIRERVSKILGNTDDRGYGYTYEEKQLIIKEAIAQWMALVDCCFDNESAEYISNYVTLNSEGGWHDLYYQWKNDSDKEKIPRRILPHSEESKYKRTVTTYFSSDTESRHCAYYVKVKDREYYYYMTDKGEEITLYDDGEDAESNLNKIDNVYHYIVEKPDGWERIAASYL